MPVDLCDQDFFLKWNDDKVLDNSDKVIRNKVKKDLFKRRKRFYIYVIAGQKDMQMLIKDF